MNAVPQSTTFRFLGALKNLFSKPETNGKETPAPQFQKPSPGRPVPPAGNHAPKNFNHQNGKTVVLPLQTAVSAMSQQLRAKVRAAVTDDLTISIPVEKIVAQLGKGAVKIPFGDIRRSASHVFASGNECDHLPVALPLSEILPRINPSALARRPGQKQTELSADVVSPFNAGGQGLTISNEAPPAPEKPVNPFVRKNAPTPAKPVVPVRPPGSTTTFIRRPATSPAKASPRLSGTPPPPLTPPAESRPIAMPAAARPAVRAIVRPAAQQPAAPVAMPINPIAPETEPVAPVAPVAAPAVPMASPLIVTLSDLTESWPETLRQEIAKLNQGSSKVALPADLIENGLKRGRISAQWKTVRSWMQPKLGVASVHDELQVDLPLSVLAPMFFAKKKMSAKAPQQKVAVDETIPNLFFGFPQSEPEPIAPALAPAAPAPMVSADIPPVFVPDFAPTAPAAPVAAPAPVVAPETVPAKTPKPADTNYYIWKDSSDTAAVDETEFKRKPMTQTEFLRRFPSPNEIVSHATSMEGVAGSLIALPDGLMVAKSIPENLNGDTLAAFLPQLFSKMSQCTKELRMGELNNLSFTVGNVPWKIFRVNAVFFAAFGHAGQQMPTAQLAALAGELDRKNK